ncbi:restriction endonuclease subunit S [Megamonas funiformis]|uniref:restriction endonuclease subunit S n=1 Tax=Megamonas funiformis TaxID=437897 RepID=UPI003FEE25F5
MAKKKQIELTIEEKLQNALVPKEEQPYKIPNNWCWTYFKDIFYIENGYAFKKIDYKKQGIPLVRISNIENGVINIDECIYVDKLEKNEERYIIEKGDLLIALSGATTGKNGVYNLDSISYLNQRIGNIKIKNKTKVVSKYRNYYIALKNEDILNLAYGGAQPNISPKVISYITIPLPPIKEQQRIVNRIESLFAKLDRAKELIENTLAQFEQNKMAILHKAFTGELTAKWRKEKGILKDTWKSMALENCGTWSGGGTPSMSCGDYWENGNIPWITSKDMKNIYIEKTQKYITEKGVEFSSAKYIDKPAILFVTRSGILRRIFPVCMVKIPFTVNQDLKVLVPSKMVCLEYLYWICIYKSNKILGTCMKSGTTVESISTDKLKKFKITVPTIEEQQEIVNILDKLLAKYNKIKNLEQQLEKIELLKKAILAKAFRGELGTNNPDEESAENLLKEILAEK